MAADPSMETGTADPDFGMLQRSAVLYANFRSGSTMLKLALGQLTGLHPTPELFAQNGGDDPQSFEAYLNWRRANDDLAADDAPERILAGYLAHFFAAPVTATGLIFDLKYSQAARLGVDDLNQCPHILSYFCQLNLKVLHLMRRDVVAQAVSHLVARHSGAFHAEADGRPAKSSIWLDPNEVARLAAASSAAQQTARAHLAAAEAETVTIYYEDLAGSGLPRTLRRMLRFLDLPATVPDGFRPAIQPQNSADAVANLDEVLDYVDAHHAALADGAVG